MTLSLPAGRSSRMELPPAEARSPEDAVAGAPPIWVQVKLETCTCPPRGDSSPQVGLRVRQPVRMGIGAQVNQV